MEQVNIIPETNYVLHRRFDRMGRLLGDAKMEKLIKSHVMVIGLGGVGSWAAESLARSGVGQISLVDFDEICITNTNRQLHTVSGFVGKHKASVMAERLQKINPQAKINALVKFYSQETKEEIFQNKPDYVIDAIDNMTAKSHLIYHCKSENIPIVSSMGSGARIDPTQVRTMDLADTATDPLAKALRKILRQKYDFPRKGKFGVKAIVSLEETTEPVELYYDNGEGFKCVCPQGQNGLNTCDRKNVIHGNASFVTGTFGFVAASVVVKDLVQR